MRGEDIRDLSLCAIKLDGRRLHHRAGVELRSDVVEHHLHDLGHARDHDDVLHSEARRDRDRVADQRRPVRDARHAQPRGRRLELALGEERMQQRERALVVTDADPQRLSNSIRRDVVMRGSDAAGGEEIGVAHAQLVHGPDDRVLLVGYDAHFLEADADARHVPGDVVDIPVGRTSGKDLVADHQQCGRDDLFLGQWSLRSLRPLRSSTGRWRDETPAAKLTLRTHGRRP